MKQIIRFTVLALSAYGAWSLYETYGDRLRSTGKSLDDFAADAKRSTSEAAEKVSSAADDASGAILDSASDIRKAALETEDRVSHTIRGVPVVPTRPSV